jgi:hypothetical protein
LNMEPLGQSRSSGGTSRIWATPRTIAIHMAHYGSNVQAQIISFPSCRLRVDDRIPPEIGKPISLSDQFMNAFMNPKCRSQNIGVQRLEAPSIWDRLEKHNHRTRNRSWITSTFEAIFVLHAIGDHAPGSFKGLVLESINPLQDAINSASLLESSSYYLSLNIPRS